ncbi:MAG: N-acetyl-gamma-glutamyl-phosphate reductase [Xanthomonadales bacterium]|nr:N-acetyl-gamma-glutamyl-phosphate reductase [Xanthomonadales bacterium]
MISVIVMGARGYTGGELLPLLYRHPHFEIIAIGSTSAAGQPVAACVEDMDDCDLVFADLRPEDLQALNPDACILALPNGFASGFVAVVDRHHPETVVVDLSADHRFDPAWTYGLPERFGEKLRGATRIANPGCYATGAQLALAPLVDGLVGVPAVFGVSGYSGAGSKPSRKNDPEVLADNLLPYSLVDHVHEQEMSLHLGRDVRFMPHVAPFFRGISLTVASELKAAVSEENLLVRYRDFYAHCPLIEVRAGIPEVKEVRGTHGVILGGFSVSSIHTRRMSMVSVLDNLLKGAATQAVQNLNLAFGLDAMTGLGSWRGTKA